MDKLIIFLILINITLSAKEDKLEIILKKHEIKVCIWPQYYGISYIDKRTQELKGIDTDLAIELSKYLGVKLKFINSSFDTLINDITSDKCDIAMFAIGYTKLRAKKIRFTSAHLRSDIYAITTKTNIIIKKWEDIDKKGVIVAVAKGTYHESIMQNKLKNAELVIIKGFKQREDEVRSGRSDVFMTDYPYAKKMLEKTKWAKLISSSKTYHSTPYSWTMAYGNDKFYNKVEEFIQEIKTNGILKKVGIKNGLYPILNIK